MVKAENISEFISDVIELFGQLLAQEIAKSPLTPKDTGLMRSTFPGTYKFIKTELGSQLSFTTPFYTDFIMFGTRKLKARPFVNHILNNDGERLLKKSFQIIDARYTNK